MRTYIKQSLYVVLFFLSAEFFSQQSITGIVTDNSKTNINQVLIINVSNQKSTLSDASGKFSIDASEDDELRFVKEGYYRFDKKVVNENFNTPLIINLEKVEIEIPEVKITYRPTGNLERDSKHLNESRKVVALRSELDEYMKSPLIDALPDNTVSKTFKGPDYGVGQVSLLGVLDAAVGLFKKATELKITKADYTETQNFIRRVKNEVDLQFLKKYGMDEERIDKFLVYANDTRMMAKKYRKNFKIDVVEFELRAAFAEYKKTNKLDSI
ncbi:carboxypeptidase-like regulatory domain-containing protein [Chryseobacterium vrystaatense]|uniref:CarboxypepD_reg-like domain-containing protein n=1 Tax=Chryseobacterium vrystaatense TaxID=307480 RepID=A0A1M4WKM6_9FLAO|nr:carboxypeptidase-like regulatory domain-containing protein [Chryseobacterium vrystaatense]SHE81747.1 hypothetical protein SAMN02787073_1187 [Chryseobacterium vrystaatense]